MEIDEQTKAAQQRIWEKWADTLKKDPSKENYAKAYDEVNAFLRDQGDPARGRAADGTVYGETGAEDDWQKSIITKLVGGQGKRVFEVGCGDGRLSMSIARTGAQVKGIDISEVVIESARKIAARKQIAIQFEKADAIELAEPSDNYDFAVSSDMVEHLNPEQVIRHMKEVLRVLKPGGAYVISVPGWEPPERVDPLHLGNYHPPEFQAILQEAGFVAVPAAQMLYRQTGDLEAVLGKPKTLKAKMMRFLALWPVVGESVGRKLIHRWCSELNFFYAQKPAR